MTRAYVDARTLRLAVAYALAGWAAFTVLLVAAGNAFIPMSSSREAPAVVAGLAGVTCLAVAVVALDYFRRAGRRDPGAGLVLGTALAAVGLTFDGVLLLATGLHYPRVDAARRDTLAAALLLGYAAAAAVPPIVGTLRAGGRAYRRGSRPRCFTGGSGGGRSTAAAGGRGGSRERRCGPACP